MKVFLIDSELIVQALGEYLTDNFWGLRVGVFWVDAAQHYCLLLDIPHAHRYGDAVTPTP